MNNITLLASLSLLLAQAAIAKLTVVAALPDLASIASYIGGDRVDCFAIAKATNDPHSVEVLPTYMVRVSRADLYLKVGLSLDQWSDQIVDGSRNAKLKVANCSVGITALEKPTGAVNASMGDVHPEGNPHYWLDPANGIIIAQNIAAALSSSDPVGAETYNENLRRFTAEAQDKLVHWKETAAAMRSHSLITYHSSWAYFAHAFGFEIPAKVEPVPGIPPTATHLKDLVELIKSKQISLLLQEPYFSDDGANYLNRETHIRILKIAPSCVDATAPSYLAHFQQIFDMLSAAN